MPEVCNSTFLLCFKWNLPCPSSCLSPWPASRPKRCDTPCLTYTTMLDCKGIWRTLFSVSIQFPWPVSGDTCTCKPPSDLDAWISDGTGRCPGFYEIVRSMQHAPRSTFPSQVTCSLLWQILRLVFRFCPVSPLRNVGRCLSVGHSMLSFWVCSRSCVEECFIVQSVTCFTQRFVCHEGMMLKLTKKTNKPRHALFNLPNAWGIAEQQVSPSQTVAQHAVRTQAVYKTMPLCICAAEWSKKTKLRSWQRRRTYWSRKVTHSALGSSVEEKQMPPWKYSFWCEMTQTVSQSISSSG